MEKIINEVCKIVKKHNFDYLDEFEYDDKIELKLEYVGDDIKYIQEEDFESDLIDDYMNFKGEQGDIVCEHFEEALEEINKKEIKYNNWEWDSFDYPCIYMYFSIGDEDD